MSSHFLGEVASTHITLLVSWSFLRIFPQGFTDSDDFHHSRPNVPRASPWVNSRGRRFFDFSIAAVALIILSPLMAVCWLLVRRSSSGPVFFRQLRTGRNGSQFAMYKFRSMRSQSFSVQHDHTVFGDSRITPAGAFLRRYKMDELPQFWNVLKGDMSLVGPRPKLAHHEAFQMPYRPGLTGRATLAFRDEERMLLEVPRTQVDRFYESAVKPIKAALDIHYMENATFFSDLRLLWRTFHRCINCSGDARSELADLVAQYAPECSALLHGESRTSVGVPLLRAHGFLPELRDDLAGDLDDAA